ncbi:hypothetical protein PoB_001398900 [Plakobranchus ocellatus]|uniref:Uncharacterized protein n=1 Tax=Plakobranchus ocellatus TaxID=259542 RepID=A0AAV3YZB0_9GAST|nr:hypothetical protein PoB_001398900 [Plakobranchus ocellatus]
MAKETVDHDKNDDNGNDDDNVEWVRSLGGFPKVPNFIGHAELKFDVGDKPSDIDFFLSHTDPLTTHLPPLPTCQNVIQHTSCIHITVTNKNRYEGKEPSKDYCTQDVGCEISDFLAKTRCFREHRVKSKA